MVLVKLHDTRRRGKDGQVWHFQKQKKRKLSAPPGLGPIELLLPCRNLRDRMHAHRPYGGGYNVVGRVAWTCCIWGHWGQTNDQASKPQEQMMLRSPAPCP